MLKRIKKRIIFLLIVTLCAANFTFVSGASAPHVPVPNVIKVYGAVDTNTTCITATTNVLAWSDEAYLNSYLYVENGKKIIGKAKYAEKYTRVQIPKQKRGTQLKIYFKNGKSRTKTIYKVVVGDRDISTLKKSNSLKRPNAIYDYDTRTLSITAAPKTRLTIRSFKKTLITTTVPAKGHMSIKLPKLKYGETIWMYVSKNNVRSEFYTFLNYPTVYIAE